MPCHGRAQVQAGGGPAFGSSAGLRLRNVSRNEPGPCTQTEFQLGCAPSLSVSPQAVEFVSL